jgi:hypothetical protein
MGVYYKVIWTGASNPYEAKRQYILSDDEGLFIDDTIGVTPLEWKCPDHPDAAVLWCHYLLQHDEESPDTCLEEDFKFSFRWSDVF